MDESSLVPSATTRGSTARSRRIMVAVVAAAATFASAGLMVPAGAAAATCPEAPAGDILFHGSLTEGVAKIGRNAESRNITGSVKCGLLTLGNLHYTIPTGDVNFEPGSLTLFHFLSFPATITVEAPAEGVLKPKSSEHFNTTQTLPVTATVQLLIFQCKVSFTPTLTTEKSGSLEGKILVGNPLVSMKGELVANEFEVPRIASSSSCPGFIAGLSNFLLGLPAKPGASSLTSVVSLEAGE